MQTQLRAEPTAPLDYSASHNLLPKALAELSYWHDRKNHCGFGEVALTRTLTHWVITVSENLVTEVIPF